MASTQFQLNAKKLASFGDVPFDLSLGLFLDPPVDQIPPGGLATLLNMHYYQNKIKSYMGWRQLNYSLGKLPGGGALTAIYAPNWMLDYNEGGIGPRSFLFGDITGIYILNRLSNGQTGNGLGVVDQIYTGGTTVSPLYKWSAAEIGTNLILVNLLANDIQVFSSYANNPNINILTNGGVRDANQPTGAKFALACAGHLIVAGTKEGGNYFPNRVRWTGIGNPGLWTPNLGVNEAGSYDIDDVSGPITGMVLISNSQFMVYTQKNNYLFTYVGLPAVWSIQTASILDIGNIENYGAIVSKEGMQFLIMDDGVRIVTPSLSANRIGYKRVDHFLLSTLKVSSRSFIANEYLYPVYTFIHPYFPEVWFVYSTVPNANNLFLDLYTSALTYNWVDDVWAQRDFPFSMVGVMYDQLQLFSNVQGPPILISGKAITSEGVATLYIHDETDNLEAGAVMNRSLRTGTIFYGDSEMNTRLSRIFPDFTDVNLATTPVFSSILSKSKKSDSFVLANKFQLDADSRHDVRLVDKLFQWGIDTTGSPSVAGVSFRIQPAGERP